MKNVITKIKQKLPNGKYSSPIEIGAKAENITFTDTENLETKITNINSSIDTKVPQEDGKGLYPTSASVFTVEDEKNLDNAVTEIPKKANAKQTMGIKVPVASWGETAPYTQTVLLPLTVDEKGMGFFDFPDLKKEQVAEYKKITDVQIDKNNLIVTAQNSKPAIDIDIQINMIY